MAREFKIIHAHVNGYFTAHCRDGWVRVGLLGCECFDFPPSHAEYQRVVSLPVEAIEFVHDEFMGKYACN